MTLEKIKLQQQNLNSRLSGILDSLTCTVTKITGNFLSPEEGRDEFATDGLLSEIQREQQKTHFLLDEINKATNRLYDFTYAPSEPEFSGLKSN